MGSAADTRNWVDLYTAFLDQLNKNLSDPKAWFERLGLTPGEGSTMALPRTADPMAIMDQQASWARVRKDIRVFGLELGEDLELAPTILDPSQTPTHGQALVRHEKAVKEWNKDPWLEIGHRLEPMPVRFKGRDALTALGFIKFWIDQCNKVNPVEQTKKMLEAQGITQENFHLHADKLMIQNPWAA
jgi:hypothetical protein